MATETTYALDLNSMIKNIELEALYIARNITQDRQADFQKLSIVDAQDWVYKKINAVCSMIFADIFSPYSIGVTDPFLFDNIYEGKTNQVTFTVIHPETCFNNNLIIPILNSTEKLIRDYVVSEWLRFSNYDYRKPEEVYLEGKRYLLGLVSRRTGLKRTYKTI